MSSYTAVCLAYKPTGLQLSDTRRSLWKPGDP